MSLRFGVELVHEPVILWENIATLSTYVFVLCQNRFPVPRRGGSNRYRYSPLDAIRVSLLHRLQFLGRGTNPARMSNRSKDVLQLIEPRHGEHLPSNRPLKGQPRSSRKISLDRKGSSVDIIALPLDLSSKVSSLPTDMIRSRNIREALYSCNRISTQKSTKTTCFT